MTISLLPIDIRGRERGEFVRFMTRSVFEFHAIPRPLEARVEEAIDAGRYDGADHEAFWIDTDEHGRVGIAVLDGLTDAAPRFDLRFATRYRGLGLGTAALVALTKHVFETRGRVTRFEGQTRDDNLAMRRVFLKAGFVKEAHLRDAWPVEEGEPRATVAYAILRRDWQTGATTPVVWDDLAPRSSHDR
jgi:RimJ/RimL family protein N-acetyltransferase